MRHPHYTSAGQFRCEESRITETTRHIVEQVSRKLLSTSAAIVALREVGLCEPEIVEVLS